MTGLTLLVPTSVSVVVLLCASCVSEPQPHAPRNHAPVARLFFAQLVTVDVAAVFDAQASDDEDGDALNYTLNPGDGTPRAQSLAATFAHVYDAPGTFDVELEVNDAAGLVARAVGQVVVVGDDASCDCVLGCFDEAVCTDAGCVEYASSVDEAPMPPANAICG